MPGHQRRGGPLARMSKERYEVEMTALREVEAIPDADVESEIANLKIGMSNLQILFAEEVARGSTHVNAVIRAGYQAKTQSSMASIASQLMREPKVNKLIRLKQRRVRRIGPEQIIAKLEEIANTSIRDFFDLAPDGTPILNLQKAQNAGVMHLIKSLTNGPFGWRIELHDPYEALKDLGQYFELFPEVSKVTSAIDVISGLTSDEERAARAHQLLERGREEAARRGSGGNVHPAEDVR